MKYSKNPVFPEGFLWGASSACLLYTSYVADDLCFPKMEQSV